MMDYNLGERYLDKFIIVGDTQQDFNEFSDFGRDHLYTGNNSSYDQLTEWAKQVMEKLNESNNQSAQQPVEDSSVEPQEEVEEPEKSSEVAEPAVTSSTNIKLTIGNFNVNAAIDRLHYLTHYKLKDRYDKSKWEPKDPNTTGHYCSRAVMLALEAGGLSTEGRKNYGGNQGTFLINSGWEQLPDSTNNFKAGDICVIKGLGRRDKKGNPMGHICMFDGTQWVSDFYQNSWDVYRGQAKRGINTHFYRYKG